MKKKFTLYWPSFVNAELNKDLGIITKIFNKYLNYHCSILCKENEKTYDEVIKQNIEMHFVEDDNTIDRVLENTDVLMLIGFYDFNLLIIEKFKSINPKGKIYLKLDLNIHWLNRIVFDKNTINLLNQCSLISVECKSLKKIIDEKWPFKVEYIPNGFYNTDINRFIEYKEKENIILTVGRLGTYEKATEILLEAFKLASKELPNWTLKLLGGIDPSFYQYIYNYVYWNPEIKNKLILMGRINDRKLIEEEYVKAKVFCLTSRCEGFPNVFGEAANKGCYIISSNVDAAWDITDDERYGNIFPINDYEALAKNMIVTCSNEVTLETTCNDIQLYSREYFDWIKLCYKIDSFFQ